MTELSVNYIITISAACSAHADSSCRSASSKPLACSLATAKLVEHMGSVGSGRIAYAALAYEALFVRSY